jgi:hypothetical protein
VGPENLFPMHCLIVPSPSLPFFIGATLDFMAPTSLRSSSPLGHYHERRKSLTQLYWSSIELIEANSNGAQSVVTT